MSALHGETEGNPFFVEEVVRHLRETQGGIEGGVDLEEAGVPEGVREVTVAASAAAAVSRRARRSRSPR